MRAAIIFVCGCVAVVFAVTGALTFQADGYIRSVAQEFVIEKTRRFAEPTVEVAEQALRTPAAKLVLDDDAIQTARQETAAYRRDPHAFIARLVAGNKIAPPAPAEGANQRLKEGVQRWKGLIQEHFQRTFDRLLLDVRIFAGTNFVAALVAALCALFARQSQLDWLLRVAALLVVSVVYESYLYVDGMSYFRILFSTYMGWWYPVALVVTFVGLYREYGRAEPQPPRQTPRKSEPAIGGLEKSIFTQPSATV